MAKNREKSSSQSSVSGMSCGRPVEVWRTMLRSPITGSWSFSE